MRHYRSFLLALICWILVLTVPNTRLRLVKAWNNYGYVQSFEAEPVEVRHYGKLNPEFASALQRFPNNKSVQIHMTNGQAKRDKAKTLQYLRELYPDDALILQISIENLMNGLATARIPGVFSNSNYPKPAKKPKPLTDAERARWNEAITLCRRGQKLEPQNIYFDSMLISALLSNNRDGEALRVLKTASGKSRFDLHKPTLFHHELRFAELKSGSPADVQALFSAWNSIWSLGGSARIRETTRSLMALVVTHRQAGQHDVAIDTALNTLKLGRIMRREGYSLIDSLVAIACQNIAFASVDLPKNGVPRLKAGSSLATFRASPSTLYSYAKAQGKTELLPYLDSEWTELSRWRGAISKSLSANIDNFDSNCAVQIRALERLQTILLRTLPGVLVILIISSLLSRRFRDSEADPLPLRQNVLFTLGALFVLFACDAALALGIGKEEFDFDYWQYNYIGTEGVFRNVLNWVQFAFPLTLALFAFRGAIAWQRKLAGKGSSLKTQLSNAFKAPEDGLARFDFGWLLGWAARSSLWMICLGSIAIFCYDIGDPEDNNAWMVPTFWFTITFAIQFWSWRHHGARLRTLGLGFRFIRQAMAVYLIAASVAFALLSFTGVLASTWYNAKFIKTVEIGELKTMRAQLKL